MVTVVRPQFGFHTRENFVVTVVMPVWFSHQRGLCGDCREASLVFTSERTLRQLWSPQYGFYNRDDFVATVVSTISQTLKKSKGHF